MTPDPLDALRDVLNAEQVALLGADYEALPRLQNTKEQLLTRIVQGRQNRDAMARIKLKIDANQSLLRAALTGIAAARTRLAELENVQKNLSVYDISGKIEIASGRQSALEKKA